MLCCFANSSTLDRSIEPDVSWRSNWTFSSSAALKGPLSVSISLRSGVSVSRTRGLSSRMGAVSFSIKSSRLKRCGGWGGAKARSCLSHFLSTGPRKHQRRLKYLFVDVGKRVEAADREPLLKLLVQIVRIHRDQKLVQLHVPNHAAVHLLFQGGQLLDFLPVGGLVLSPRWRQVSVFRCLTAGGCDRARPQSRSRRL